MTVANPAHQLRSKLSLRVTFRDRTSRREAVDFAAQLTDSLAAGLESSGLNIKVVRPNDETKVQPNFHLVGDVQQHTISNFVERNTKSSKYRSGEQDQVNEDWNAADREYESANMALQTDQRALEGAEVRGKKSQIADAKRQAEEAQKKVEAARVKLDSLQKFRHVVMERPYTYTEQINHLKGTVELGFTDSGQLGSRPGSNRPHTRNPGKALYRARKCEVRRHHGSPHPGRGSKRNQVYGNR